MIKKNGKVIKVFTDFDGFIDIKKGDFYKMNKGIENFWVRRGIEPSRQWGSTYREESKNGN